MDSVLAASGHGFDYRWDGPTIGGIGRGNGGPGCFPDVFIRRSKPTDRQAETVPDSGGKAVAGTRMGGIRPLLGSYRSYSGRLALQRSTERGEPSALEPLARPDRT